MQLASVSHRIVCASRHLEVDNVQVDSRVLLLEKGGDCAAAHAEYKDAAGGGGAEDHDGCSHVAEDRDGENVWVADYCGGLTHAVHRAEFQAADPSEVVNQDGLAGNRGIIRVAQLRGFNR
jgi:hypothetical protein